MLGNLPLLPPSFTPSLYHPHPLLSQHFSSPPPSSSSFLIPDNLAAGEDREGPAMRELSALQARMARARGKPPVKRPTSSRRVCSRSQQPYLFCQYQQACKDRISSRIGSYVGDNRNTLLSFLQEECPADGQALLHISVEQVDLLMARVRQELRTQADTLWAASQGLQQLKPNDTRPGFGCSMVAPNLIS
jgi:hypothetical protein